MDASVDYNAHASFPHFVLCVGVIQIMTFPWKYYESDAAKLLSELMLEKPQIAEEKNKGLALWWDRTLDLDEMKRARESEVKQQAYVYQTKA
jgi:uncharacterized protein DUF3460